MIFALDKDGNRVYIDDSVVKNDYFCPCCGEKLVLKKGNIRRPHYSHQANTECHDLWRYDMSDWHYNWQNYFPKDCQEIVKIFGDKKHRADVLIEKNKTVIEFQHSSLDSIEFEDRNNFYTSLGYKVIWIFDLDEPFKNCSITELENKKDIYKWNHPKSTFNHFEFNKNVELYFEFSNQFGDIDSDDFDEGYLAKVSWKSQSGFEVFAVNNYYTVQDFLLQFANVINLNYCIPRELISDRLLLLKTKDHTSYYYGCPLSKDGKCISDTIDYPVSMLNNIKVCLNCEYCSKYNYASCVKRFVDLNIPENACIKNVKYENGFLKKIDYVVNQEVISKELPSVNICKPCNDIITLWKLNKPRIAIFYNVRTKKYVKIGRDPFEQYMKYKRVYGSISEVQYNYPKENKEVYGIYDKVWILTWSK